MRYCIIIVAAAYVVALKGQVVLIDEIGDTKSNETDNQLYDELDQGEDKDVQKIYDDDAQDDDEVSTEKQIEYIEVVNPITIYDLVDTPTIDPRLLVIDTAHGPVQGFTLLDSPGIVRFIDIPYGKVENKFEAPYVPESWTETHQVQQHNILCPQPQDDGSIVGQIDCLTLNVFTPYDVTNASVLFHIHESNFQIGSGDPSIYGPDYLVPKGIILVLPNYRLGPFGFMCLNTESVPGNAGLKDLALALEWTFNNIYKFGGNPNNIVVSGEGTAGVLVGYLSLSEMSSKFISKAITESGAVLSHAAIDRTPINTASALAKAVTGNDDLSFDNILESDINTLITNSIDIHFRPCIENGSDYFINTTPWNLINKEHIVKHFMIGSASLAGMHDSLQLTPEYIVEINTDILQMLPDDLHFDHDDVRIAAASRVRNQYFEKDNISIETIDKLCIYYTDLTYLSPAIRLARPLLDNGANVYLYEFSYQGKLNPVIASQVLGSSEDAARGDIIGYLFKQDGLVPEPGSEEEQMVDILTDLWVTFINEGEPKAEGITWNQLVKSDETEEEWLSIGAQIDMEQGLHVDRLSMWSRLYHQHFIDKSLAAKINCETMLIITALIVGFFSAMFKYI